MFMIRRETGDIKDSADSSTAANVLRPVGSRLARVVHRAEM